MGARMTKILVLPSEYLLSWLQTLEKVHKFTIRRLLLKTICGAIRTKNTGIRAIIALLIPVMAIIDQCVGPAFPLFAQGNTSLAERKRQKLTEQEEARGIAWNGLVAHRADLSGRNMQANTKPRPNDLGYYVAPFRPFLDVPPNRANERRTSSNQRTRPPQPIYLLTNVSP